jgi:hypothetical protein
MEHLITTITKVDLVTFVHETRHTSRLQVLVREPKTFERDGTQHPATALITLLLKALEQAERPVLDIK